MKGFYRMLNHEFAAMGRMVAVLCAVMFIATWRFVGGEISNYSEYAITERFETIIVSSGTVMVGYLIFLAFSAYCVIRLYSNYWGSRSIYTLLALPMKRESLYASRLTAFVAGLLVLLAVQWLCIRFGYQLVVEKTSSYGDGKFVMQNGLFLAVARSAELRLFMPVSLGGFICSAGLLAAWATGLFYAVACERSRKYWGLLIVAATAYMMFRAYRSVTDRMWMYDLTEGALYGYGTVLFLFAAWFVWHSIRIYRRGAIA